MIDAMTLTLAAAGGVLGAVVGVAGCVFVTRQRNQALLARQEAEQIAAVKELRQMHASATRKMERHAQQVAQASQLEREQLQDQLNKLTQELDESRVALMELMNERDAQFVRGNVDFAPTEPMAAVDRKRVGAKSTFGLMMP